MLSGGSLPGDILNYHIHPVFNFLLFRRLVLCAGNATLNIKSKRNCHNALNFYFCVNGSGPLNTEVAMLSTKAVLPLSMSSIMLLLLTTNLYI